MGKEPDLLKKKKKKKKEKKKKKKKKGEKKTKKKKKKKKKKWPRKNKGCIVTAREICSMLILVAAVGNK